MKALAITMTKDPRERLDYDLDFSRWLTVGDTISSATAEIADGTCFVDQTDTSATAVKIWIAGGAAAENATVTVLATTTQGRIKEVSFRLRIRET